MGNNGGLTLEDKLLIDPKLNYRKFTLILLRKSFLRFLFILLIDLIFYYYYFISFGWVLFTTSGISFLIAGTKGTAGLSVTFQKLIEAFSNVEFSKNIRSKEEEAIGATLIYSVVGLMFFFTSMFFY